jgi:uncharacterized protein
MINSNTAVGSVVSLWRYPVKSMLGEELNATQMTEKGLLGDRAYALIDMATGMTVSAKNPRKWGKMFDCRATLIESNVKITLPDGAVVLSNADDASQILSQLFGREIKLETIAPQKPSLEEY